jgi:hypothetical protein
MSFLRPGQQNQEQRREVSPRIPERRNMKSMSPEEFSMAIKKYTTLATYFMDPMTGERLPANRPPDCVLQDKEYHDGYEFLKQFGDRVDLEVMLAPHTPNKPDENFGDRSFDFEGRVKAADIVLFEGMFWKQKDKEMLNALSSKEILQLSPQQRKDVITYEGGDTSLMRKLDAINGSGAKISFYDIEQKDDESGIRKQLLENINFHKKIQSLPVKNATEEEAKIALDMAQTKEITATSAIREWCMVAGAGYQIGEFCQNNQDIQRKFVDGNIKVLMVVGASHKDLIRKFKTTAVSVEASSPVDPNKVENPLNKKLPEWIAQGFIDNLELKRLSA